MVTIVIVITVCDKLGRLHTKFYIVDSFKKEARFLYLWHKLWGGIVHRLQSGRQTEPVLMADWCRYARKIIVFHYEWTNINLAKMKNHRKLEQLFAVFKLGSR